MLEYEILLKAFDDALYKNVGAFCWFFFGVGFFVSFLFVFDFFFLLKIQGGTGTLRGI